MSFVTSDGLKYYHSKIKTILNSKSDTSHTHNLSTMINSLGTGESTPVDADYYVCQYAGGGLATLHI